MTLWLRVRRVPALILALFAVTLTLAWLGERQVVTPTVIGGGATGMLWSALVPLAWAAAVAWAFELKDTQVEARPGYRVAVLDSCLFVMATLGACAVFIALAHDQSSVPIVAHLMLLTSVAVGGSVRFGPEVGISAATALLLITTSYSPRLPAAGYIRVLQPDGNVTWALGVGVTLFVLALAVLATPRSSPAEHSSVGRGY